MHNFKKTVLAAAVISMVPAVSHAQLEEVLVTATKREASVQDLPFSINAMSEQEIRRTGSSNMEDLSRNVAALTIQNLGPGQSQVAIRGVSAGQIIRDQPGVKEQVGVYMDETVISLSLFTPDLDLYDLNRVETLRGPQGTLFGSGSVGGTIRMITNQPMFDEFEGSIEADINTVTDGEEGGHLKGAVNIPMGDRVAMRIVGYHTEYAGFIDGLSENGAKKDDVNDGNRSGARLALAWQATDNLLITPRVIYQEIEADGFNRQEVFNLFANPYTTTRPAIQLDEREQYLLLDEKFEDETLIADLTINWSLDSMDLTYAGSYTDREILVSRDASALTGSVGVSPGGFAEEDVLLPSRLNDTTDLEQQTHELRLASSGNNSLDWVAGVFYSDVERIYAQRLPTPGHDDATRRSGVLGDTDPSETLNGFPGPDSPYNADIPYDIEQTAVFGEATWHATERLHLTLGGRWYDFEEERTFTNGGWFAPGDFTVDETESDGFNPRVMASYDLSDEMTVNAQASQGFRLGGVNDPLNVSLCEGSDVETFGGLKEYDDETLWNYEIGFKSMFDAFSFNTAVFYTDIEDLQTTLDAGSCSSRVVFNAPEAHTLGVEWELTAYPVDNFLVTFNGSYIEAEFDSTLLDNNGNVLGGIEDGNRLASVPELQLSASATYTWNGGLFGANETYLTGLIQHVGERYTQPGDQVDGAGDFQSGLPFGGATGEEVTSLDLELDAYELININFGMLWDTWEAMLYVNNVADENVDLSFDRERGGRARLAFRTNQPRTVGLTVRKVF